MPLLAVGVKGICLGVVLPVLTYFPTFCVQGLCLTSYV